MVSLRADGHGRRTMTRRLIALLALLTACRSKGEPPPPALRALTPLPDPSSADAPTESASIEIGDARWEIESVVGISGTGNRAVLAVFRVTNLGNTPRQMLLPPGLVVDRGAPIAPESESWGPTPSAPRSLLAEAPLAPGTTRRVNCRYRLGRSRAASGFNFHGFSLVHGSKTLEPIPWRLRH